LRRRNFRRRSKYAGRDAISSYREFQQHHTPSRAGVRHPMFPPCLIEDLFSIHDDIARCIHSDSDSVAFDIEDGHCDAVSYHQSFGLPAGQNEHVPLPPRGE
jgi:hypothetical protein